MILTLNDYSRYPTQEDHEFYSDLLPLSFFNFLLISSRGSRVVCKKKKKSDIVVRDKGSNKFLIYGV